MKKLLKSKRGITLIALVITIIVLLILAGVTVATLTGENGLLARAQLAKERTVEAEQDEKDKLSSYENELTNYNTRGLTNIDYSLDEQDTGLKWIDGKKIYQISYYKADAKSGDNVELADTKDLNIDTIVNFNYIFMETNGLVFSGWEREKTDTHSCLMRGSKIHYYSGNDAKIHVTLRYTKK